MKKPQTFNIIKHRGTLDEAVTLHGDKVTKQDKLFVIDFPVGFGTYTGFIPCLDYGNHFIYEVKDSIHTRGLPAFMCTCGAPAIVIGYDGYSKDQSFEGLQFACSFKNGMFNEETGEMYNKHADGSS